MKKPTPSAPNPPVADVDVDEASAVFGAAAHEIKNALGPLAMTLQLAERQALTGQPIAHADLAFARAQVRRISRLVVDLMDLTRADLGQLAIEPVEADLRPVIAGAVEAFRRGHGGEIQLAVPGGAMLLPFDGPRIEQVLANLLENAARYSPAGTAIAVEVTRSPSHVRVAVRDRGPGVAPHEQARIFERFVRGAAAAAAGGLGIGLYLCRMIVERHGGKIGVDSTPQPGAETGSCFWFELPSSA